MIRLSLHKVSPILGFKLNSFLCRNRLIDCNPRHTRKVTSTIIINQKSGSIYLLALSAEDRFATTPIKSNYDGTVNSVAKHREIVVLFLYGLTHVPIRRKEIQEELVA